MVVICFCAMFSPRVTQDRWALPSTKTVQAPHWPSPQPYLVPIRSRFSRNTVRRLIWGSASTVRGRPLIARLIVATDPPDLRTAQLNLRLSSEMIYPVSGTSKFGVPADGLGRG